MLAQLNFPGVGEVMGEELETAKHAPDDAALVRQFQSGIDPAGAIEELFSRYALASYAFFLRSVGDPRMAEDLNQELYVEVIKSLRRFRLECAFRTWLFRLAYSYLSNLRRRLRTHLHELPSEQPSELWEELLPDPGASPEVILCREEATNLLRLCLARLPELERAVVLGHYYDGNTLRELTHELDLPNRSGARAFLIAAQRKLRRCMKRSTEPAVDPRSS